MSPAPVPAHNSYELERLRQVENRLTESESRFRRMADEAPAMIYMIDEHDRPYYFNRAWLAFTGRSLEAEIAAPVDPEIHPEEAEWVKETYYQNARGHHPIELEYRRRHHSGAYRWIHDRVVPRFLDDGTYIGYVGFCFDIDDRKQAEESQQRLERELVEEKLEQQRRINTAILEGSERERAELSMELHDNVNQLLTSAKLYMEVAAAQGGPGTELTKKSIGLIMEAIGEIRHLSHRLAPLSLRQLGFADAVEHLIAHVRQSGIQVTFTCRKPALFRELSEEIQLACYRIVQEQTNNIVKYSRACRVRIVLDHDRNGMLLQIEDDGIGFDPERVQKGLGLTNIATRAALCGGSARFDSKPGQGCRLEVRLPLPPANQNRQPVRAAL